MSNIEVIGAGWGRTSTTSLQHALQILGYDPCYHMREVVGNDVHAKFWTKVADKKPYNFDEVFKEKNFTASVDAPSSYYWREQLARYPNAKVILTIRDSQKWYDSAYSTIFQDNPAFPDIDIGIRVALLFSDKAFSEMILKTAFRDCYHSNFDKVNVIKCFEEWNASVIRDCPKDQLLVFEAHHGWEPLCKFLNKPIPSVPYPHVNDTKEYSSYLIKLKNKGRFIINTSLMAVLSVGWCLWFGHFKTA